jgi:3-methyladenine DNA glycosylase AlkD
MNSIIDNIRQELKENSDEKFQHTSQSFFKEKIKVYGIKTDTVRKIGKTYFASIKNKSKAEIFELCEKLWESGYIEESGLACDWSFYIRKQYTPNDFNTLEKWTDTYISNWAACDGLCTHTIGAFLEMYPEYTSELKRWAVSKNRWMRRASAVSLIMPVRHGKYLHNVFEIADILLMDNEDMVQKGYGWMLKVASQKYQKEVFDYVMKNKANMPRTALRYAIEKMPSELQLQAMAK